MRVRAVQRIDPFGNTCFTGVDFLPAADEADDDRPTIMSVHRLDEELWLRLIEIGPTLLLAHEQGGFGAVPSALRFIEDHDAVDRRSQVAERLIPKVVDVLNEGL